MDYHTYYDVGALLKISLKVSRMEQVDHSSWRMLGMWSKEAQDSRAGLSLRWPEHGQRQTEGSAVGYIDQAQKCHKVVPSVSSRNKTLSIYNYGTNLSASFYKVSTCVYKCL